LLVREDLAGAISGYPDDVLLPQAAPDLSDPPQVSVVVYVPSSVAAQLLELEERLETERRTVPAPGCELLGEVVAKHHRGEPPDGGRGGRQVPDNATA